MFKTLYGKLSLTLFLLLVFTGVLFLQLVRFSNEMYQQEVNQKLNSTLAAGIVKEGLLLDKGEINQAALQEIFHMLMVINPAIEVYLLDKGGRILAYSAPPGKVKRRYVDLAPIQRFIRGDRGYPILGQDPRNPQLTKVFSAAPVPASGAPEGYLYVILGGEIFDSVTGMIQGSYIMRYSLWGLAASLLIALLAGALIFAWLTRRLRRLAGAMDDYSATLPRYESSARDDEIDRLGQRFNAMADRIHQQMQQLRETDALRRELIANVSHDLRTPLASLHGYLETLLLKADTLNEAERRRYVEIAVSHSKRLGSLVNELFELATLEACETPPHSEPFTLAELVQDVAQKFQLAASEKGITIRMYMDHKLPFAYGDVGMIQRVLENLIENALRHTPPGGEITLTLGKDQAGIRVQVKDTGCGIPSKELPHIFDRFFSLRKKHEGGTLHAGLGLAIARRIMELHKSMIDVDSTIGRGTTFSFYVPVFHR